MTRDEFSNYNLQKIKGKSKSKTLINDTNIDAKTRLIEIGKDLINQRKNNFMDSNKIQFRG